MIHQLITQWTGKAPISKQLCRVLEVSRSGFYSARQRASRHCHPQARAGVDRALRPRQPICECRALAAAARPSTDSEHKGNCWDNAVMERFFLNLKMERVWQRDYANHAEAKWDIADYIVSFYNSVRLHSSLGYCAPAEYEDRELLTLN